MSGVGPGESVQHLVQHEHDQVLCLLMGVPAEGQDHEVCCLSHIHSQQRQGEEQEQLSQGGCRCKQEGQGAAAGQKVQ